jgi:hypothetical protein
VGGGYDDNIFFTGRAQRQGGSFLRVTPTLSAGWQPRRSVSFDAAYSADAELYREFPELNDAFARQRANLGFRYSGRKATFFLGAAFDETNTASDLVDDGSVQFGRINARGYTGSTAFDVRYGRSGSIGLHYSYRLLQYTDAFPDPTRDSHFVGLSWSQELAKGTRVSVRGGPRFATGDVAADVSGTISHRFRRSGVSLGYNRTIYLGPLDNLDTESITFAANRQLGRYWQVSATAAGFRYRSAENEGDGLRGGLSVARALTRWLLASASYQHVRQENAALRPTVFDDAWLFRNTFYLGLTFAPARRSDSPVGPRSGP